MIFSIITVFKRIKEEGGIKLSDDIRGMVVDELVNNQNWQKEAEENCTRSFDKVMLTIDGDDAEKVLELMRAPRNMQDAVWTWWMTTIKAAIMVVDNWTII